MSAAVTFTGGSAPARLVCGDARELIRAESDGCSVMLTDPVWPGSVTLGPFPDIDPVELLGSVMGGLAPSVERVIVTLGYASDPRLLAVIPERFPFRRVQVLRYALPGFTGRFVGGCEFAYSFGSLPPNGKRLASYSGAEQPTRKFSGHPCPRHLGHMLWLAKSWVAPGEAVIDPFSGTGTTAEACYRLGLPVTGIEIEERWHADAVRRLRRFLI